MRVTPLHWQFNLINGSKRLKCYLHKIHFALKIILCTRDTCTLEILLVRLFFLGKNIQIRVKIQTYSVCIYISYSPPPPQFKLFSHVQRPSCHYWKSSISAHGMRIFKKILVWAAVWFEDQAWFLFWFGQLTCQTQEFFTPQHLEFVCHSTEPVFVADRG